MHNFPNSVPELGARWVNHKWQKVQMETSTETSRTQPCSASGAQKETKDWNKNPKPKVWLSKNPRTSFIGFRHLLQELQSTRLSSKTFWSVYFLVLTSWKVSSSVFSLSLTVFFKARISSGDLQKWCVRLYAYSLLPKNMHLSICEELSVVSIHIFLFISRE